jgi:hypothetical protein
MRLETFSLRSFLRFRVNLDGPKRKTDAVLEHIAPDGLAQRLTGGKVTTYDQAVASLLPAPAADPR